MQPTLPIQVTSLTPAACGSALWRQADRVWATVIVKATFCLVHDDLAELTTPLELVREDRSRTPGGSIAVAAEMAPYLPNAGVVLSGHAYAPGGRPTASSAVRLGVAGVRRLVDKTVHVFGDQRPGGPAAVQPFEKMPLVYERALGGPDNPIGVELGRSAGWPNLVDPIDPRRPVGFGPVPALWPSRRRLLGALDPARLTEPVPEFPRGFPWGFFQAAPADQQFPALQGDEWIVLDGMHPALPRVHSRLPDVRVHAEWQRVGAASPGPARVVDLSADTLVIDADAMLCCVVWRGRFPVERFELWPAIRVTTAVELSGRRDTTPVSVAIVGRSTAGGTAERSGEASDPDVSRTETAESLAETRKLNLRAMLPVVAPAAAATPAVLLARTQNVNDSARSPLLPFVAGDGSTVPSPSSGAAAPPPAARVGTGTVEPGGAGAPALPFQLGAESLRAQAASARSAAPGPTLASTLGPGDPASLRPALPFAPTDPAVAPSAGAHAPRERHPEPRFTGTGDLDRRRLATPPTPFQGAGAASPTASADPEGATAALRATVLARVRAGAMLDDLELKGADLSDLDLGGANLAGLNLHRVVLRGARLAAARLTHADLSDADLSEADLAGAVLQRAIVERARFDGASLREADLSGARGAGASFRTVQALRGTFARGVWEGAVFDNLDAGGADFTGATLGGATFRHAWLGEACFGGARGVAVFDDAKMPLVRAQGSRLGGSSFRRIDAPDSRWEGAALEDATFEGANLKGASFVRAHCSRGSFVASDATGANLQHVTADGANFDDARLAGADLRQAQMVAARFRGALLRALRADGATLRAAILVRTDLTGASLRGAKLGQADLAHARLDDADLRDADLTGANLHRVSRKATKMTGTRTTGLLDIDPDAPLRTPVKR